MILALMEDYPYAYPVEKIHRNTVKNWNERFLVAQCKQKQSDTLE